MKGFFHVFSKTMEEEEKCLAKINSNMLILQNPNEKSTSTDENSPCKSTFLSITGKNKKMNNRI